MTVYVGGLFGKTPSIVTRVLKKAFIETLDSVLVPGYADEHGYPQKWTFEFLDGYTSQMRWTTSVTEPGDGTVYELYVENFEVAEDELEVL